MDTVFNILVVGFAGLIAYWWSNQGLLSALLHLTCVICAGALAFATWEPITGIFLDIPAMQDYSYGVGLLLPFAVYLLVLRVAADKLAPDNLNFPHAVNLTAGIAAGAASGILTVGIALIGMGHTHSSADLMGVKGVTRTASAKGQPDFNAGSLWVPCHSIAGGFYSMLSTGSMRPTLSQPTLASHRPGVADQAMGLFRDTYQRNGRIARVAAAPGSIKLADIGFVQGFPLPDGRQTAAYLCKLQLEPGATTPGNGFAISASQLPLIGTARGDGSGMAFPLAWSQPNSSGGQSAFIFDDVTNYMTSPPGTTSMEVVAVYKADAFRDGEPPRFLTAMGLRLPVTAIRSLTPVDAMAMLMGATGGAVSVPDGIMAIAREDLAVNDSILPANADLNNLGAMDVKDENYLFEGLGEYEQGGFRGNKAVVVRGIWAPRDTRIMRLNISRGNKSSIDLWNDRSKVREEAGPNAELALIDELGRAYKPIGFIHSAAAGDRKVTIRLQRGGQYYSIDTFPNLSSAGTDQLYAIFTPMVGRTIVGVKLGDKWVCKASVTVTPPL
ncbi:MAG: hypothetical protein ACKOYN_03235 [Planctomycetota bacterium]